jgi:hypothetical protein
MCFQQVFELASLVEDLWAFLSVRELELEHDHVFFLCDYKAELAVIRAGGAAVDLCTSFVDSLNDLVVCCSAMHNGVAVDEDSVRLVDHRR